MRHRGLSGCSLQQAVPRLLLWLLRQVWLAGAIVTGGHTLTSWALRSALMSWSRICTQRYIEQCHTFAPLRARVAFCCNTPLVSASPRYAAWPGEQRAPRGLDLLQACSRPKSAGARSEGALKESPILKKPLHEICIRKPISLPETDRQSCVDAEQAGRACFSRLQMPGKGPAAVGRQQRIHLCASRISRRCLPF